MADENTAKAFLNIARQYRLAGNRLVPLRDDIESPVYFLYTHALELALKAFLRAHDQPVPRGAAGHDLQALLQTCQGLGLHVGFDLRNVVEVMRREYEGHGFRYFLFEPTARPELGYLAAVVDELLSRAEAEVVDRPSTGATEVVIKLVIGKPEEQSNESANR